MPLQLLLTNENATDPFGVMSAGDSSQETTFMKQEALNLEYDVAVSLKTVDNGYEATRSGHILIFFCFLFVKTH